jgi:hypothetical protein
VPIVLCVFLGIALARGLGVTATKVWVFRGFSLLAVALMGSLGVLSVLSEALLLQALVLPRRPVRLLRLLADLRPRLRPYLRVMAPYYLGFGLPILLLATLDRTAGPMRLVRVAVALGMIAWAIRSVDTFWFAAQATVTEGLEPRAARERSRALSLLMREHVPRLEMIASGLLVAIALASGLALGLVTMKTKHWWPESWMAPLAGVLAGLVVQVPLMPLGTIAFGLLYFRTREASGEPLPRILATFEEKLGAPASVTRSLSPSPTTPPRTA